MYVTVSCGRLRSHWQHRTCTVSLQKARIVHYYLLSQITADYYYVNLLRRRKDNILLDEPREKRNRKKRTKKTSRGGVAYVHYHINTATNGGGSNGNMFAVIGCKDDKQHNFFNIRII